MLLIKKFGYKALWKFRSLARSSSTWVLVKQKNAKVLDSAIKDLETITGQKVVLTRAKNSVANPKIREGMPIGCKTTLRGEKMYDFMDRLVNLALPRVRDCSRERRFSLRQQETFMLWALRNS